MFHLMITILFSLNAHADGAAIQTDCKPAEIKILSEPDVLANISIESRVAKIDCHPFHFPNKEEKLLVLYVLNSLDGMQTFLVIYSRNDLTEKSHPRYKSDPIGVDSFPIMVGSKHRLLFVLPGDTSTVIELYTNTQNSDGDTFLAKHILNLKLQALGGVPDHLWKMDPTKEPRLLIEKGKWRAIVAGKIVDL